MSRRTPIGRIDTLGDGRFQWTIDDILSQVSTDELHVSPDCTFLDRSCNIYFSYEKPISISFVYLLSPPRRVHVELRMVTDGKRGTSLTHSGETDELGYFRTPMWLALKSNSISSEFLPEGRFTLFCNLKRLDAGEIASASSERLPAVERMQKDLKNLLVSGEECDVIIKVQGKEFPAHRIILRARSPVFKSMFSHDMVEKLSGVVVIDDCDPATFPDFLNYVYTGSTKQISHENVFSLYTASDKYGVGELKEECAAFMKRNMSVGTFCDTVTLALRHTEKELIDLATEFFRANLTEIIKTAKWQTFLHENTTVGNELLIKALSNG